MLHLAKSIGRMEYLYVYIPSPSYIGTRISLTEGQNPEASLQRVYQIISREERDKMGQIIGILMKKKWGKMERCKIIVKLRF